LKLTFARKMMRNAENSGISGEQWGGRPNRTAIDTAFKKLLTLYYERMTYKTIEMFANDATTCFDRMVPVVSSLIARKFGVAASIMKCRNVIIKKLKRNVRTDCGDSEITYEEEDADD
ncbi:MAG: hypothetical protein ACK55I_14530, partial [bacterium]